MEPIASKSKIDESQIANYDFFKAIETQVTCPICLIIFTEPVQCKSCQSIICKSCLEKCEFCPISRCSPLVIEKVPQSFKNILNTIIIKCEIDNCLVPLLDYLSHKEFCKVNIGKNSKLCIPIYEQQKKQYMNIDVNMELPNFGKLKQAELGNSNIKCKSNDHNESDETILQINEAIENENSQRNALIQSETINPANQSIIEEVEVVNKKCCKKSKCCKPKLNQKCCIPCTNCCKCCSSTNLNEDGKQIIYVARWIGAIIPKIPKSFAILIFILNIFIPGLGTILLTCFSPKKLSYHWIFLGIAHLLYSLCIVGYIMCFSLGIILIKISNFNEYFDGVEGELLNNNNDDNGNNILVQYDIRNEYGEPYKFLKDW